MNLNENDGYLNGSYYDYGYVAIINGFTSETKKYISKDGLTGTSVVYPLHCIPYGKRIVLHKNYQSNNKFYDQVNLDNSWHLVQFSRSGGLFSSVYEADKAVKMYLSHINETNKKAEKEIYSYEDLNVEIKKIRFECSMKIVQDY